jgi:hypothetical protein
MLYGFKNDAVLGAVKKRKPGPDCLFLAKDIPGRNFLAPGLQIFHAFQDFFPAVSGLEIDVHIAHNTPPDAVKESPSISNKASFVINSARFAVCRLWSNKILQICRR